MGGEGIGSIVSEHDINTHQVDDLKLVSTESRCTQEQCEIIQLVLVDLISSFNITYICILTDIYSSIIHIVKEDRFNRHKQGNSLQVMMK